MRIRTIQLTVLALVGTLVSSRGIPTVAAQDATTDGNWKLVVLAMSDEVVAIVKISRQDNKLTATVVDSPPALQVRRQAERAELNGDGVTLALQTANGSALFRGKRSSTGASASQILGTIQFAGNLWPARLEPTTDPRVGATRPSPMWPKYVAAMNERDTRTKVKMLEALIEDNHGAPNSQSFYSALLVLADRAGFEPDRVSGLIERWSEEAKPYGNDWVTEVRLRALKSIMASKKFAKQALKLAIEADKTASDGQLDQKAAVVELLARAARNCGEEELARAAESRHSELATKLDEEFRANVPPFKPASYAGRKDSRAGKVVLMELFTGSECPPCVAADVAFDALLDTYKPVDFIGLQYHVHIPGPDPLTNKDAEARLRYYAENFRGAPSPYFNGRFEAGGGGFMGNSERKYTEYRAIIDKILETPKTAKITASATRAGDQVKIIASAEISENPEGQTTRGAREKSDEKTDKTKRMLRLALTEASVRYTGGNKLRFHQHVVRAFPGGTEGKQMTDGKCQVEVTLSLADLKRDLEDYLSDFAKRAAFPKRLPEIKLDDLALVAFIQDDDDQSILQAVSVPVQAASP
jgi:thiol-disulfide isomerase/thioredoxin